MGHQIYNMRLNQLCSRTILEYGSMPNTDAIEKAAQQILNAKYPVGWVEIELPDNKISHIRYQYTDKAEEREEARRKFYLTGDWRFANQRFSSGVYSPKYQYVFLDLDTEITLDEIIELLTHELTHAHDPKIHGKPDVVKKFSNYPASKDHNYFFHPVELDAFFSSEGQKRRRDIMSKKLSIDRIKEVIRNLKPYSYAETAWYNNPKIWRQYQKYLYKLLIK